MSKELGFSVRTCILQGEGESVAPGTPRRAFPTAPGFSYQTEPAEMSRRPSLLKSPMPTPSERKARSRVVFLKLTLAGGGVGRPAPNAGSADGTRSVPTTF